MKWGDAPDWRFLRKWRKRIDWRRGNWENGMGVIFKRKAGRGGFWGRRKVLLGIKIRERHRLGSENVKLQENDIYLSWKVKKEAIKK